MALYYVRMTEHLIHIYVVDAATAKEAEANFKEQNESTPFATNHLEYTFESVELVPEKDKRKGLDFLKAELQGEMVESCFNCGQFLSKEGQPFDDNAHQFFDEKGNFLCKECADRLRKT
jgi:hypothetical protein